MYPVRTFLWLLSKFWNPNPISAAERVPAEILCMILEASEDFTSESELFEEREDADEALATFGLVVPEEGSFAPFGVLWKAFSTRPTIALRKFDKNRTLLTMSHVCRAWRDSLIRSKILWRDIAFDVSQPKSIRLARNFFDAIKDFNVTFRVYAGLGDSVDFEILVLFQNLRVYLDRWEVFEYQGSAKGYRQYLDIEARNLLRFSGRHDFSSTLFPPQGILAGKAPSLQCLHTSEISNWLPITLSNVTELNISYGPRNPPFSVKSLIGVFRSTPNLEVLQLASPKLLVLDCAADETIALPRLERFRLYNPDIYTLITHLQLPGVRSMTFSSSISTRIHNHSHPIRDSHDIFSPFPPLSLLEREYSLARIRIGFLCNGLLRFNVEVSDNDGRFFGINLNLPWEGWCQWRDYFARSITVMTERVKLRAGASLEFASGVSLDCETFLGFGAVGTLMFDGSGREILHKLLCVPHGNPPTTLFPRLGELVLLDNRMDHYDFALIPPCLRWREGLDIIVNDANNQHLYVVNDRCVVEADPNLIGYLRIRLKDGMAVH